MLNCEITPDPVFTAKDVGGRAVIRDLCLLGGRVNYPYGQGFPGQPGGPQQPGFGQQPGYHPQGYQAPGFGQQPGNFGPQPGFGQQPYGMGAAEPSSVTGMIAAILAGLGGLGGLASGLFGLVRFSGLSSLPGVGGGAYTMVLISLLVSLAFGGVLLAGAIMLLQRKMLGRWLIVGGCAASIVVSLLSLAATAALAAGYGATYLGGGFFSVLGLIFPIATIVLALVPSTTAWIRSRPNSLPPQPYSPY
jgi:hypothetical protein